MRYKMGNDEDEKQVIDRQEKFSMKQDSHVDKAEEERDAGPDPSQENVQ